MSRRYQTVERVLYDVAHRIRFRAKSRYGVHPIRFQWFLEGQELKDEGVARVGDADVQFSTQGRNCQLQTKSGVSLRAELCLHATDCRGNRASSTIPVFLPGQKSIRRRLFGEPAGQWARPKRCVGPSGRLRTTEMSRPAGIVDPQEEFRSALAAGMGLDLDWRPSSSM